VLKDFFAFSENGNLSVTKFENLAEDPNAAPVTLTPGNSWREGFGLACWRDEHILIAGGFKALVFGFGSCSRSVLSYRISTDEWKSMPNMMKSR